MAALAAVAAAAVTGCTRGATNLGPDGGTSDAGDAGWRDAGWQDAGPLPCPPCSGPLKGLGMCQASAQYSCPPGTACDFGEVFIGLTETFPHGYVFYCRPAPAGCSLQDLCACAPLYRTGDGPFISWQQTDGGPVAIADTAVCSSCFQDPAAPGDAPTVECSYWTNGSDAG